MLELDPRTMRERRLIAEAERRGLHLTPVNERGVVWLHGRGVDVLASSLAVLDARDLEPRDPCGPRI